MRIAYYEKEQIQQLMAEYHELVNVEGLQTKYNAPFSSIKWSRLESLLEVICFIFHSECNVKIAKTPTESFLLEIILPDMIINGNRRVLFRHDGLPTYKKYLGENKDIIIRKPFEYNEISEFVNSIKTIIMDFFKNPITRGYGY